MKAERQSKSASCGHHDGDACDECEAVWPWICRADSQSSRADDQQAAEHEVGHGHGQLGRGLHGRARPSVPDELDRRFSSNERLPPTARRRRAKKILAVVEGEATPLPPLWAEGRPYPPTPATPPWAE